MFLPIGDTPKPRNFVPVVTWGFIALNLIVYLLVTFPLSVQAVDPRDPALLDYLRHLGPRLPARIDLRGLSVYDLFVFEHGYKPAAPSLASLFSSMFLHGGFLHLAGNMLFLGIYGRNVEHRLGRIGYLVGYLGSGVVATLAFSLLTGPSWSPLVGASGAIAGVLGFYFVLFPRNRVKMLVVLPPFFFDVFLVPARLVLGLYILVDNLLPLMSGSQSSVAYGAHLGGFFAGLVGAMVGERLAWQWPWKDPLWRLAWARGRAVDARAAADPVVEQLRSALDLGDRPRALAALSSLSTGRAAQLEPHECVILARWLRDAGYSIAATNLLRVCLAAHPGGEDLAVVYLTLGLMRLEQGQPTAAYQHLLSVFDYDPSPEIAARARAALEQIDIYQRRRRADLRVGPS